MYVLYNTSIYNNSRQSRVVEIYIYMSDKLHYGTSKTLISGYNCEQSRIMDSISSSEDANNTIMSHMLCNTQYQLHNHNQYLIVVVAV